MPCRLITYKLTQFFFMEEEYKCKEVNDYELL